MTNQQQPPYGQSYPQQQQPQGYAQQPADPHYGYQGAPAQKQPIDRGVLRQLIFGAGTLAVIVIATSILSVISNSFWGLAYLGGELLGFFIDLIRLVLFLVGMGLSALYIAPIAKAAGTIELLTKLLIGGAIGAIGVVVVGLVQAVMTNSSYVAANILGTGIVWPLTLALGYTAYFALGVLIARTTTPTAPAVWADGQTAAGYQQAQPGYAPPAQPQQSPAPPQQ